MVKAGILDGDMVIVHRQPAAQSGEIVIAMIDDEATCKRLKYNGENIWLLPENDDYAEYPAMTVLYFLERLQLSFVLINSNIFELSGH